MTVREDSVVAGHVKARRRHQGAGATPPREGVLARMGMWPSAGGPEDEGWVKVVATAARIVATGDVCDAPPHEHCYKPSWTGARVIEVMRDDRGSRFTPPLFDVIEIDLPMSCRIRLSNLDDPSSLSSRCRGSRRMISRPMPPVPHSRTRRNRG